MIEQAWMYNTQVDSKYHFVKSFKIILSDCCQDNFNQDQLHFALQEGKWILEMSNSYNSNYDSGLVLQVKYTKQFFFFFWEKQIKPLCLVSTI